MQNPTNNTARGLRHGGTREAMTAYAPDIERARKPNIENRELAVIAPRLVSMRQVTTMTTYSRPSIYRLIAQGRFPKPIKLGDVKIAFRADDVEAWLASRPTALGGDDTNI